MSRAAGTPTSARADLTVPEDRVSRSAKFAYALGGVNGMFGNWFYASLAKPVFNMNLGLAPMLVGGVLMGARLAEGFSDILVGWISDNTRSRWGRRRPYILLGSILAGVALPGLFLVSTHWDASDPWQSNRLFWFMLVSTLLYAPMVTLYSMPYASLGSEMTPSYHERTSVMAIRAVAQKIAGVCIASAWWITRTYRTDSATGQPDMLTGARFAAMIAGTVMIVAGCICFRWTRERYYARAQAQKKAPFWRTAREAWSSRPFRLLIAVVVLFAVATSVGNDLGLYAGTYYVFGGDQTAMSRYSFLAAVGQFGFGLGGVWLATWWAKHFGKRRALSITLVVGMLAYGASWWMYTPGQTWLLILNMSLTVVASSGLWVLSPSMCADVVDDDELRSGMRREGTFNSWMSWIIKSGLAFSMVAGGAILEGTGFDAARGSHQSSVAIWWIRFWFVAIPVAALGLGLVVLWLYPLTQKRVEALRVELEAVRGRV